MPDPRRKSEHPRWDELPVGAWWKNLARCAELPRVTASAFAFPNPSGGNIYPRYFNSPNQRAVCAKIAALGQGADALAFGSDMAAISTTLPTLLDPGDHGMLTLIDNTFATPYNQTPLTAGVDLVLVTPASR